jgi:hypothetical protein
MNKKTVLAVVAVLAIVAAVVMYRTGHRSSHLSELKNFWWMPLPLAALCLLATGSKKT